MSTYVQPPEFSLNIGKRKKKKKPLRDPAKPKRVPSSFLLFCQDHRERLRQTHPDVRMAQIQKFAAEEWSKMDAKSKKPYEERHHKLHKLWYAARTREGGAPRPRSSQHPNQARRQGRVR